MSHRQPYTNDIPQYVGEPGNIAEFQDGEEDEAMEEVAEEQGYASSTPTSSSTWISWFCSLPGHEYFCEVTEDFIEDDFNLTGLNALVPFWKEAMEIVLDVEPEDALKIPDMSIVESSAELLYGLVHQRYILTRPGLQAMVEKYEAGHFGICPRVYCQSCHVSPCGRSDLPGLDTVKLYCPNCNDIYTPPSSRYQSVDGAFFGTTFAPLLFQTYREIAPAPFCPSLPHHYIGDSPESNVSSPELSPAEGFVNPNPHGGKKRPAGKVYEAKLFGFKVNERARGGPRMKWLRMRPETLEELDHVDWLGQWKDGIDEDDFDADGEDEDDENSHRRLENFDDDLPGEDNDEEDEEEDGGGRGPSIPYPPAAPSGRLGRGRAAQVPTSGRAPARDFDDEIIAAESDSSSTSSGSSLVTPGPCNSPPTQPLGVRHSKSAMMVVTDVKVVNYHIHSPWGHGRTCHAVTERARPELGGVAHVA